jgi:hypothetical protein
MPINSINEGSNALDDAAGNIYLALHGGMARQRGGGAGGRRARRHGQERVSGRAWHKLLKLDFNNTF